MPIAALSASEQARLQQALDQTNNMISMLSDPASVGAATLTALGDIEQDILALADRLAKGPQGCAPLPMTGATELGHIEVDPTSANDTARRAVRCGQS